MRMETWEERKNPRKDSKELFLILPMTALLAELEWNHFMILFKILSVTVIAC